MWTYTTKDASSIHNKKLCDVKFNCDGSLFGAATVDKAVKIAQLLDNSQTGTIRVVHSIPCSSSIAEICWHPSDMNRFVIIGGDKMVDVWDVKAARPALRLATLANNIHGCWSPNGQYLAIGNNSDVLLVFDMAEGKQIKKARYSYEMNEIGWSVNSDYLLIAYGGKAPDSGGVDVLSVERDLELVHSVIGHTGNAYSLRVDPSGRRMAMSSGDALVSLWDLHELICYNGLFVMETVTHICFNGDGKYLAIAGDLNLAVCDVESGEVMVKIDCRSKVSGLCWHPGLDIIGVALDETEDAQRFRDKTNNSFLKFFVFDSSKKLS